jgi:magnesium chelatase subunit I
MTPAEVSILPYHLIVGQEDLRRALEIAYVVPAVGGVLAGERGTAKSTTVRAFANMVLQRLPVTLPIGATDDRVLGGWDVEDLLQGTPKMRVGLLEQAQSEGGGLLYIDEVNLLDDYLINIILDAASGGVLPVEREGIDEQARPVRFTLVGTMNPEEGQLRPQLLDRFGLVATIEEDGSSKTRRAILRNVLEFDADRDGRASARVAEARAKDNAKREQLNQARAAAADLDLDASIVALCADIAAEFQAAGHRGELTVANAARALAAINQESSVRPEHVAEVAPLALVHRRATEEPATVVPWSDDDAARLESLIGAAG